MSQQTEAIRVEMPKREEKEARPDTERFSQEQLEERVEQLGLIVEGMHSAPSYVWVAEGGEACDVVEELRVQVEALRWMLRIGKRLSADARDMVIGTVCRSVKEMEKECEARISAGVVRIAA